MKRIALFTVIAALFFGSLAVVLAGPSVPPQQYYIRWKSRVPYTCSHMPGDDRLVVITTYFDYNVPAGTQMSEEDATHSSYGDTGGASSITDWTYGSGVGQQKLHGYQLDSKSYPMMAQVTIGTIINHILVYKSTFTATCTGNSQETLHATIVNDNHPLPVAQIWAEGNLGIYRP